MQKLIQYKILYAIVLALLLPTSTAVSSPPSAFSLDENWVYENYPVFKNHNINLKIMDKRISRWDGLFVAPKTIIIVRENIKSQASAEGVVNHELMHYYCWYMYKNPDPFHTKCFPLKK